MSFPTWPSTMAAQDSIDLHMHTTYSDGHWAPSELFGYLAAHQFTLVAVTDHDRVDRLDEMFELGREHDVSVLTGVEVTTDWDGRMTHLLCYGFDPARGALATLTQRTFDEQLANTHAVYAELLRRGHSFPRQAEILAATQGELDRPVDNAKLLRDHGYVTDIQSGITAIRDAGFRSITAPLVDAVAASHADGGIAIIAHPGRGDSGITHYTVPLLEELATTGIPLDGIEVYYPLYTPEQVNAYATLANTQNWLLSAGSDSHGPRQRYPIAYRAYQIAALLARCGITLAY